MTLALADYTDNETVRGLLGVSEEEIPDDILDSLAPGNLLEVTFALEDLNTTIPALFETYKAIDVNTRTALQSRFYGIVRLYAAYVVSQIIANGAVEMFAPITIQDGRTALQTRADDPYAALRAALTAGLGTWRTRLTDTLAKIDVSLAVNPTKLTLVGSAGLATDPVTGV